MILDSTSTLKKLVSTIATRFMLNGIKLKRTRLYEILAENQGFKSKVALVEAIPLLLDADKATSEAFLLTARKYVLPSYKASADWNFHGNFLANCAVKTRRFPMIAPPDHGLEIFIDWTHGGEISYPSLYHKSHLHQGTFDELEGRTSSIRLKYYIEQSEYEGLCESLRPFIDSIMSGCVYDDVSGTCEFNEVASEALENMIYFASDYEEFMDRETWGADTSELYFDDDVDTGDIEEGNLTAVYINGLFLLDHSFTDIKLRQLVAEKAPRALPSLPICHYAIYRKFRDMRNACRNNFLANCSFR